MTSSKPEIPEQSKTIADEPQQAEAAVRDSPKHSATTSDEPAFGWSSYAERANGRFAMIGFVAILLIEAFSNNSFLHWAGLIN